MCGTPSNDVCGFVTEVILRTRCEGDYLNNEALCNASSTFAAAGLLFSALKQRLRLNDLLTDLLFP